MARPRNAPQRAFVWTWLPGATEPVVAGVLDQAGDVVVFTYGRSYLGSDAAVPLYLPELPLQPGPQAPQAGRRIAGVVDDAGPDAWGMRVVLSRLAGRGVEDVEQLPRITYLLESGSDRIGALDFQTSADVYESRGDAPATLEELARAAELIDEGQPLPADLDQVLIHGSEIGGARPKATLVDGSRRLIAKFSSSSDVYPVVQGEFLGMKLAKRAGLDVASVELVESMGRWVIIVERFDRPGDGTRRSMVSALTMLDLNENTALFSASYANLADLIRDRFPGYREALPELFRRIVFNILIGNTDDHPRNHAAFWDGRTNELTLTPAYDLTPIVRRTQRATQLMAIGRDGWRESQLAGCIEHSAIYQLNRKEAKEIVDEQISAIKDSWLEVCDEAKLTDEQRKGFAGTAFFNPYAFLDYSNPVELPER